MSILFIGGAGFIGNKTLALLKKKNKKRKLAIYDNFSGSSFATVSKGIDVIVGDTKSASSISSALLTVKPDTIIFGAGPVGVAEDLKTAEEAYTKNVVNILNLCKNLRESEAKPSKVILLSDACIYGEGTNLTETSPLKFDNYYAQSFDMAESLLQLTCKRVGIGLLILRLPIVYGVRQEFGTDLVSFIINCALDKVDFAVFGSNKTARDFVYIDELVEKLATLIDSDVKGVLNLGGQHVSIGPLVDEIIKRTESKSQYKFGSPAGCEYKTITLDYSLAKSLGISFDTKVSSVLDSIIKKTKEYKKNKKKFEL